MSEVHPCPRVVPARSGVVRRCPDVSPVPSARGTPAPALSAVVNLAAVHAHAFAWTRVFTPPGPIAGAEAPGPTAALSLAEDLPAWPLQQLHGVARPPAVLQLPLFGHIPKLQEAGGLAFLQALGSWREKDALWIPGSFSHF